MVCIVKRNAGASKTQCAIQLVVNASAHQAGKGNGAINYVTQAASALVVWAFVVVKTMPLAIQCRAAALVTLVGEALDAIDRAQTDSMEKIV